MYEPDNPAKPFHNYHMNFSTYDPFTLSLGCHVTDFCDFRSVFRTVLGVRSSYVSYLRTCSNVKMYSEYMDYCYWVHYVIKRLSTYQVIPRHRTPTRTVRKTDLMS